MLRTSLTSESVTEGHPDKLADRISDAVLDAILAGDPSAHVACETFLTTGLVLVGGEITTQVYIDIDRLCRRVIASVGYDKPGYGFNHQDCAVLSAIKEQSPEIAAAVAKAREARTGEAKDAYDLLGAGDQGIVYGYACTETDERMPLPIVLAHGLTRRLAAARRDGTLPYLRPDGKSQVTVEYASGSPRRVSVVVLAAQHDPDVDQPTLHQDLLETVIRPVLGRFMDERTEVFVNSSGSFVIGGPASDTGMTGRKIIVDTYGGHGSHGGGAFSGKDPTKVDRSGAYMARYVAKNLVAAGLARDVGVQVAYAIGRARPLAVHVESRGTGVVDDEALRRAVLEVFDFRPAAIIERLDLLRPIYEPLSCYGHFGRSESEAPWERTDRTEELRRALPQARKVA
jgi:S-adenosylmethionine synthetase